MGMVEPYVGLGLSRVGLSPHLRVTQGVRQRRPTSPVVAGFPHILRWATRASDRLFDRSSCEAAVGRKAAGSFAKSDSSGIGRLLGFPWLSVSAPDFGFLPEPGALALPLLAMEDVTSRSRITMG